LGADVPFFLHGRPVRARGIGDRLSPLVGVPPLWLVIVYPGFPVSTRWVYEHFRIKLTKPIENTSINFLSGSPDECRKFLVNDLEAVTLAHYPRIADMKEKLIQAGASGALMSGTGSSVFGIFTSRLRAEKAFGRLRMEKGVQAFLVRVLS
jgi:4-diphosphocytidyl-2-C-methyl-D-erythritol kinase